MNNNVLLCFVLLTTLISYGYSLRECYHCESGSRYNSNKACTEDEPEKIALNRLKVPDEIECHRCSKIILNDGSVYRGCVSKPVWDQIRSNFRKEEGCAENVRINGADIDGRYCVCEASRCNSSSTLLVSLLPILIVALTIKLLI